MKFINLTGHEIIVKTNGETLVFPNDDSIEIKMQMNRVQKTRLGGVPIHEYKCINKDDILPPKVKDTYYIVASKVKRQFPEREDFVKVSKVEKDYKGNLYCLGFTFQ